jgi:hypothetical protein
MLSRDFREFLESLNANSVRYLVVGGYAVALHGYPRYTKDLDVWIEPTAQHKQAKGQRRKAQGARLLKLKHKEERSSFGKASH